MAVVCRIFGLCQPHINCVYWPHSQLIMKNLESVFGRISGVCQPYVGRISAVYQPYIHRMSAVCQPSVNRLSAYVSRISAVYPPYVSRGMAVWQPYVRRMSGVYQPFIRRISAIPNLPICRNCLSQQKFAGGTHFSIKSLIFFRKTQFSIGARENWQHDTHEIDGRIPSSSVFQSWGNTLSYVAEFQNQLSISCSSILLHQLELTSCIEVKNLGRNRNFVRFGVRLFQQL